MIQEKIVTATAQTSIAQLIRNYANYNLWANSTLVSWLRTKPAALLEKEMASSFPGIRLTLVHILQTQRYWLSIIRRDATDIVNDEECSTEDVLNRLVENSQELADYVNALGERGLSDQTLVVSPWFQCDFQNFEYVMHIVTHSTYHRGQVTSIGRQLGFADAPMTDYNFYNVYMQLSAEVA